MNFTQRATVPASPDRVWDLIMDVPAVASCVPGVGEVAPEQGGRYRGRMQIAVGPVRLNLAGTIAIEEQDRAAGRAAMWAEATDRRVNGGLRARVELVMRQTNPDQTELAITTEATLLGKLGEFGQPLIRRKADTILEEFARNLAARLAPGG